MNCAHPSVIIHESSLIAIDLPLCKEVEVCDYLGSGGFGDVWKVKDTKTGQHFALKHIKIFKGKNEEERQDLIFRTIEEANIRIDSPYVMQVYGYSRLSRHDIVLLMEYVEGIELHDWIQDTNHDWDARLDIFMKILKGVKKAHDCKVTHRDLKPSNIVVTPKGVPKILDFGMAKSSIRLKEALGMRRFFLLLGLLI